MKSSDKSTSFFEANLENAVDYLRSLNGPIEYKDFLEVHRILFSDFYPWAGKDRRELGVGRIVSKASKVQFEFSDLCQKAVEWGLSMGNNPNVMMKSPGKVMGTFAWGHPFLDGNGRVMLLVHSELCHRSEFSIDWRSSKKDAYLDAVTKDILNPNDGFLDDYFSGLIRGKLPHSNWVAYFKSIPGLDGSDGNDDADVSHLDSDIDAITRYEEIKLARRDGYRAEKNAAAKHMPCRICLSKPCKCKPTPTGAS